MSAPHLHRQRAAQLDAEGRHDDAVNELALAAQAGDTDSMLQLGKRLVVGDRAPYLPREGAGLVYDAAQKGQAQAVALMAVFQCVGIFQRQSWNDSLITLAHAAQLGCQSAQEQVLLLAQGPAAERAAVTGAGAPAWARLAADIDLGAWLSAPQESVLLADPLLKSFPRFLPPAFCARMIAQSRRRLKPALVYDANARRDVHSGTRTNSIAQFPLVDNEVVHFILQQRMACAAGVPMNQFEATAILNYKAGEQIMNHYDFVDTDLPNYEAEIAANGQRIITFLIYLNDEYEGGATAFPKLGISHKGSAGEGFYFTNALSDGAPDHRVLHAGAPPRNGEKWIVSQFIRNRAVKYILDS